MLFKKFSEDGIQESIKKSFSRKFQVKLSSNKFRCLNKSTEHRGDNYESLG